MTLKREKGFLGAVVPAMLIFGVLAGMSLPAQAQPRDRQCRDYARDATDQSEQNDRNRCGFQGPRWSGNTGAHFAWCMLVGPRQADNESDARKDDLRKCLADRRPGGGREGKRANCDTYAAIAEVQADANDKYKCGFRGGEWNNSKRDHFQWCMRNKRDFMLDEIRYRAQELQKCFNNMGDYDDDNWDRNYRRRF